MLRVLAMAMVWRAGIIFAIAVAIVIAIVIAIKTVKLFLFAVVILLLLARTISILTANSEVQAPVQGIL